MSRKNSFNIIICILLMSIFIASCDSNTDSVRSFSPDITEGESNSESEAPIEPVITNEPMPTSQITPQITDIPDDADPHIDEVEYEQMEVHFIDVGEGDSTLIKCGNEAMLIDAGTPDKGTAIRLYLKKQEIGHLKYLLLTHSDKDHIGGAASVVSNIKIDNIFMCRYEKDNDVYLNLINEINYKNMT